MTITLATLMGNNLDEICRMITEAAEGDLRKAEGLLESLINDFIQKCQCH